MHSKNSCWQNGVSSAEKHWDESNISRHNAHYPRRLWFGDSSLRRRSRLCAYPGQLRRGAVRRRLPSTQGPIERKAGSLRSLPAPCSFRFGGRWGQALSRKVKHMELEVTTSRLSQADARVSLFHRSTRTTWFSARLAADYGGPWIRERPGNR